MKISEYIVNSLKGKGIKYVFGLQGSGTALQIFDALGETDGIDYVCTLHEQAAGMAADAYANISEGLGVCVVDSGPATTNLFTAVAGSYYNSNSVIYIVGQAQTSLLRKNPDLRFYGYHENNNIVEMYNSVTKYVVQIENPNRFRYEFEKALFLAQNGRPGPVLLALPDDITWLDIDPEKQEFFPIPQSAMSIDLDKILDECWQHMKAAKRPILLVGSGVRQGHAVKELIELIDLIEWPIALTWGVRDILPYSDYRNVGSFGAHGSRPGNFAVQNSDFLLCIGARLDLSETGGIGFARGAYVVSTDVERSELEKYPVRNVPCNLAICSDAATVINGLIERLKNNGILTPKPWLNMINIWKSKYPLFLKEYHEQTQIEPYAFVETLSKELQEYDVIITDTATSRNYIFQAFQNKKGQRLMSWLNFACLGYGLPGAIGACFAKPEARVIAVMGDGALQFNIQELATAVYHRLNLKLFIFNNNGFSSICYAQNRYMDGRFHGSDRGHGLPLPDSAAIIRAYGIPVIEASKNGELSEKISEVLRMKGLACCIINDLPLSHWTVPCKMGKDPIEDMTPKLPRAEFYSQMIVPPLE